jgi:hypothetical protein
MIGRHGLTWGVSSLARIFSVVMKGMVNIYRRRRMVGIGAAIDREPQGERDRLLGAGFRKGGRRLSDWSTFLNCFR